MFAMEGNQIRSHSLIFLLCVVTLTAAAATWETVYTEDFDGSDWQGQWTLSGSVGRQDQGALQSGGLEFQAKLNRQFDAPAIRVEFDAVMCEATAGAFSDLSVFVGDVFFQFGGEWNTQTTIRGKGKTRVLVEKSPPLIEVGKTYHIVAEVNGRRCTLTVDGKVAAQALIEKALTHATITLYTWRGNARFDNVRVQTSAQADPVSAEFVRAVEEQQRKLQAENAVEPRADCEFGELRASPTIHSIGFEWEIQGDTNHNATCEVRYRPKRGGLFGLFQPSWKQALPLLRIDYRGWYDGGKYKAFRHFNMLAGSILFLEPDTAYEVELTAGDPDGGNTQKTLTIHTRAEPKLDEGGRKLHVVPGEGGGDGSPGSPFRGIAAAEEAARPGDVFLLHGGQYASHILTKSGEPGRYVAWKAYGDGEAVLQKHLGLKANHLWIEGLVFEQTDKEEHGGVRGQEHGLQDIVIVGNLFRNTRYSVSNPEKSWNGDQTVLNRHWYIADNVCEGGAFTEYFTRLYLLADSDLCYNRIATSHNGKEGDGIAVRFCTNLDIYGNDIYDADDDVFEPDSSYANIRIWRNRGVNPDNQAISFQPMLCSPWYIVQNEFVLAHPRRRATPFKTNVFDRHVVVNNTFVVRSRFAQYRADVVLRSFSRNNLWCHLFDNPYEETTNPGGAIWFGAGDQTKDDQYVLRGQSKPDWKTDVDYDGFAWNCTKYEPFWWFDQRFSSLSAFAKAVGIESHAVWLEMNEVFGVPDLIRYGEERFSERRLTLKQGSKAIDAGQPVPNLAETYSGAAPDLGAYEFGAPKRHYGPRSRR